jgi:hypothetical protein
VPFPTTNPISLWLSWRFDLFAFNLEHDLVVGDTGVLINCFAVKQPNQSTDRSCFCHFRGMSRTQLVVQAVCTSYFYDSLATDATALDYLRAARTRPLKRIDWLTDYVILGSSRQPHQPLCRKTQNWPARPTPPCHNGQRLPLLRLVWLLSTSIYIQYPYLRSACVLSLCLAHWQPLP